VRDDWRLASLRARKARKQWLERLEQLPAAERAAFERRLGQAPVERLPRLALQHLRGADAVVVGLPARAPEEDIQQRLQHLHQWGQDLNVGQVVLSHVGHQAPPHDTLEALAAEVAPSVHIAYDGLELAL